MRGIIIPVVFLLVGTGGGVGAGLLLSSPKDEEMPEEEMEATVDAPEEEESIDNTTEFARLNNQFVVPIVKRGEVTSMVVLSLSIEVSAGNQNIVYSREPRLRDALLQALFDHANMGGFDGNFTEAHTMQLLRDGLNYAAKEVIGEEALDVLIVDLVRQEV